MNLILVRHAYLPSCTLGWLRAGDLKLATIERPWVPHKSGPGGTRRISCIEDGEYAVRPHSSERFRDVWALENPHLGVWYQPIEIPPAQEWGRSAILLHAGNRVTDVVGCIAIGLTHGTMFGEHAVLSSQIALAKLRDVLGAKRHQLFVRPTAGTCEEAA